MLDKRVLLCNYNSKHVEGGVSDVLLTRFKNDKMIKEDIHEKAIICTRRYAVIVDYASF